MVPEPLRHGAGTAASAAMAAMSDGFARARSARPDQWHVVACLVAGRPARLEIVGDALAARLAPIFPIRPTASEAGGLELHMQLWDEHATGIPRPQAAASAAFEARWDLPEETYGTGANRRLLCLRRPHAELWFERSPGSSPGRILGALRAAEGIPLNLCGKPFQPLLAVWCRDRDIQLIHAGLIAVDGRGLLIAGASGAGKSTTSLACACHGFGFLGDDCVGFDRDATGAFRGHALYASGFLMPRDVARLPDLAQACEARADQPKQLVYLARAPRIACEASVPLAALILTRLSDRVDSVLRPASKRDALLAMTPSSMLGWRPRQDARGFESLAALTLELPIWGMDAGRDLAGRARALRDFVASGDW